MSDTINTCSICELIKYYLLHWKFDMTCSTCGRIWKLPISPAKKESKRKAIGKKEIEMSQEEMKQLKRTRRLSLRDSDTKRKRKSHLLKSELKQELQPELIRTKTGQKLERTKLEDENVTILCPNDWCSHQHRIARPRVPNALLTMKRLACLSAACFGVFITINHL